MTTREALHDLLDELPENVLSFAEQSLQRLKAMEDDPLWQSLLNAPEDDEPTTPEDLEAIERGYRSIREGRGIPHAEVERLLGL
ncbi:MAG: hypothetical protein WD557_15805 [Dehalococcoidia bacterium]